MATRNRIPDGVRGVMVTFVDPAGPARLARLRSGQVILEVNRRPVTSALDFRHLAAGLEPGEAAAVLLYDPHPLVEGRVIAVVIADPRS